MSQLLRFTSQVIVTIPIRSFLTLLLFNLLLGVESSAKSFSFAPPTGISISKTNIQENNGIDDPIGILSTIDIDEGGSYTYSLVPGSGSANNLSFKIIGNQLVANQIFDFETKTSYVTRVQSNDGNGNLYETFYTITITDQEASLTLSNSTIEENNELDDVIGTLTPTDIGTGNNYTYSLVPGSGSANNLSFKIIGNQLVANQIFDFETKTSYVTRVQSNDGNGNLYETFYTITITDQEASLTLSNSTIEENNELDDVIGILTPTDIGTGNNYTYSLVPGSGSANNLSFKIIGNQLVANQVFDFETKTSYVTRVQSNDGNGNLYETFYTITITDQEASLTLSNSTIEENNELDDVIGTLTPTDIGTGNNYTYSLVPGSGSANNLSFKIIGNQLVANQIFDFETKTSYVTRVQSNDGNGNLYETFYTITITDQEASLTLSNSTIEENNELDDVIGTLTPTDIGTGNNYTYSLVPGSGSANNLSFKIIGNQLVANQIFDFETKTSYVTRVQSNDGNGNLYETFYTITITDQEASLTLSNSTIEENNELDDVIGTLTPTDIGTGNNYTYSLVPGSGSANNLSFKIIGNQLVANQVFDFETKTSYVTRVQSNDGNGNLYETFYSISVIDVEEVTWDGTNWSNGTGPTSSIDAVINGDYSLNDNGDIEMRKLIINSGFTLTVDNNSALEIANSLVNNGSIIIESGASLLTYDGNTITGNDIEIRRNTRYADGKYSFVGSPVAPNAQTTAQILGDASRHVYTYDESVDYGEDGLSRWSIASSQQLVPGKGYAQAFQQEVVFEGLPNDGTITFTGTYTEDECDANEGWNLVSNPYASAINVADFLAANLNTTGSVYIWDDNGSAIQRGSNADYIVANGTMASATAAGGSSRYNNHLGSAQGFFIKLNDNTNRNVVFTEEMRRNNSNGDANFFRKESLPIVRLNLTNDDGLFKQAVIGFADDAEENAINTKYDALAFTASTDNGLFTMKAGWSLTLNGMPKDWQTIQLRFNVKQTGRYKISAELDGYTQFVYLHDKVTNQIIDLSIEDYSFNSQPGFYTERFEMIASPSVALGLEDNHLMVFADNKTLYIHQFDEIEREYFLFDLNGRQLLSTSMSSNKEINLSRYQAGIYLLFDGEKTHKVIIK